MPRTTLISRFSNFILGSPLIWGGLACLGFYAVLGQSTLNSPTIARYFESHPVEYITTGLFFVGLAALVMKVIDLAIQGATVGLPLFDKAPDGGQRVDDAPLLLSQLDVASSTQRSGYLVPRLREAVEYVRRKGSADSLDAQLHYLADEDHGRMQASYALVRIVIWAIPILGFLGTVIGITLAIAQLSAEALEDSLTAVTGGLGVAFDTTALALSLSIVLMFAKFFIEQFEIRLLAQVDNRVNAELVGRFQQYGAASDPQLATVQRAADAVKDAASSLIEVQAETWRETMEKANEHWTTLTATSGEVVEKALAGAVSESIDRHAAALEKGLADHVTKAVEQNAAAIDHNTAAIIGATEKHATALIENTEQHTSALRNCLLEIGTDLAKSVESHGAAVADGTDQVTSTLSSSMDEHARVIAASLAEHRDALAEGENALAEENRRYLSEVQLAIVESAGATVEHQEQLVRQAEVLLKVVDATGQVKRLEETLNENLAALAGSHNFEETVTSLAAAIQLLSSRLGQRTAAGAQSIQLDSDDLLTPTAA